MSHDDNDLDLLASLIAKARRAGADGADALAVQSVALSHARRLGKVEKLERAESRDVGLRVLIGQRQAIVSSSDRDTKALDALVERAIAMARAVPEDPFCALAPADRLARELPDLDICDPAEPAPEALIEAARACEEAALAVPGITNSEGAEASWSLTSVSLAASNGFAGAYRVSRHGLAASVVAGEGMGMERDYEFSSAVRKADLDAPDAVGRRAAERAVRRLNPRKVKTAKLPIIFDPRVANSIPGHLAAAINGSAIARGTSFLKDRLGQRVLPAGTRIVDDPRRLRGLRSKPFDGEGVATARRNLVEDGVLTTWLLDMRSARQLGLATTGHAARGTSSPPSPSATNLYLEPGALSPAALIAETGKGFYVTELIGFGINGVTGDYSRGAVGLWIDGGTLADPVSEVTIAGNLKDMLASVTPANDLAFRYGTDAPTLRIDGMTVAGV